MAKNTIIDIDAEFDGVEFDEHQIKKHTAAALYSLNAKTHIETRLKSGWAEKNKKSSQDPEVRRRRREGVLASQTEEVKLKRAKSCQKCIMTPEGPFPSVLAVIDHYNKTHFPDFKPAGIKKRFYRWIKEDTKNFYYISKEEYIMLTGKDI
jgi:hypothetical protein